MEDVKFTVDRADAEEIPVEVEVDYQRPEPSWPGGYMPADSGTVLEDVRDEETGELAYHRGRAISLTGDERDEAAGLAEEQVSARMEPNPEGERPTLVMVASSEVWAFYSLTKPIWFLRTVGGPFEE